MPSVFCRYGGNIWQGESVKHNLLCRHGCKSKWVGQLLNKWTRLLLLGWIWGGGEGGWRPRLCGGNHFEPHPRRAGAHLSGRPCVDISGWFEIFSLNVSQGMNDSGCYSPPAVGEHAWAELKDGCTHGHWGWWWGGSLILLEYWLTNVYMCQVVEEVLKERWKFAQTYSLGGATAEERQPVWYQGFLWVIGLQNVSFALLFTGVSIISKKLSLI